ncbi:MAG: hypothetical protein ABIT36_11340 [Steroidobacteraceae bacterium]
MLDIRALTMTTLWVVTGAHAATPAQQQQSLAIYKQLVEINTATDSGWRRYSTHWAPP